MYLKNARAADDEGDYDSVFKYTSEALKRIAPVNDKAVVATQVTINLSESRKEALDAETIEVDAVEVVEAEDLDA